MSSFNWHLIPLVGVICVVTPAFATAEAALDVHVEPHKSLVVVGEPVLITAVVTNRGLEPVKLILHNAPTIALYPHSVADLQFGRDELHLKHWSDGLRKVRKTAPKVLAPGETIMIDLVMLFSREDGFFAREPGKYWVQGRIVIDANSYIEILSPPVPIEVRAPSTKDQRTWRWLDARKEEYGRLVQIPWEAKLSDEFLADCARTCDTSQSPYVEYLALFLSRWYREGPQKDAQQSARFAEIAKARASSEKIRSEALKAATKEP